MIMLLSFTIKNASSQNNNTGFEGEISFETYENYSNHLDSSGSISYEKIGVIKPVKGKIKDNRYLEEEDAESILDATEFEVVSGKNFVPGMLIREK